MMQTERTLLGIAFAIAAKAHLGQFDKGGSPYILHPIAVWQEVSHLDLITQQVAILHDVVEDSDVTLEELRTQGFSEQCLLSLSLMTKTSTYDDYIVQISKDLRATYVKLADLRHNSDITRLKGLDETDFRRMEKYCRAYEFLKIRKFVMEQEGCHA